ncbi:MAG TPA: hypothetical protein P5151_04460 [Bacteroidales bacterium]|nr:hypothetical protein [Bacteroidales bacterium]
MRPGWVVAIILINLTFVASAQQSELSGRSILFRGVVIDAETQARIADSKIYLNGAVKTITGTDGTFSFLARPNDTVVFRAMGYQLARIIVSDTLRATEFLAGIYLKPDTISIGEVIILPRNRSLKTELMASPVPSDVKIEYARSNVNIAAFQGRTGQYKLGDPEMNYELLRQVQKKEAYEKGGIPSDRIVGISPLLLLPAAYLILHGLPEPPAPPEPQISQKELEELNKIFLEKIRNKK